MSSPEITAFVVNETTGKAVSAISFPSVDFLDRFDLPEGHTLVIFPKILGDIEAFETTLEDGAIAIVPRQPDPELALVVAKLKMWEAVKASRDARIMGGITVPGIGEFDSTPEAIQNVAGAALTSMIMVQAGLGNQVIATWTLRDNSSRDLTADEMLTVQRVGTIFINDVHARARDLRSEIEAAQTIEDLQAIDILAGWPS